jgi:hypothetical protein
MFSCIKPLYSAFVQPPGRRLRLAMTLGLIALMGACGGGGGGGSEAPVDISNIVVPTVTITSDAPAVAKLPFTLTFTFSGPIMIYSADGILPWAVPNGSAKPDKTTFKKVSDTKYTVVVKPTNQSKGDWKLILPPGAYKDVTGVKYSTEAASVTQAIDTQAPFAIFSATPSAGQTVFTGPTTVTISFNTLLDANLTAGALVLSAFNLDTQEPLASPGVISNFVKTSFTNEKNVYTFLYTPPAGRSSVVVELPAGAVSAGGAPNESSNWSAVFITTP